MNEVMHKAINLAKETMRRGIGGPFGAAVVDKDGNILSVASNTVLRDHDPTAHAEINAIREACKRLRTHDLSECILYATSEPCPMCLSAIMWANIRTVYYGCTAKDAADIEFRDDFIYGVLSDVENNASVIHLEELDREICLELFKEYKETNKQLY